MRTTDFDFDLPPELIAQEPRDRGDSRLLVLERGSGEIALRHFADLTQYLAPGDTLVINDSRVTARRVKAWRANGLPAEALLLRPSGETAWEAMVRPGRSLRVGSVLAVEIGEGSRLIGVVRDVKADGIRVLDFGGAAQRDRLAREGVIPLPPYIHRALLDEARYQTVYAGPGGSAAAPTAGLHFTPEALAGLTARGVQVARVTLHVGIDTFRPIRTETIDDHVMHGEAYHVSEETAEIVNRTPGRVIAVGTTAVRVLESAATPDGSLQPGGGETRMYITPGYTFRIVAGLITNFHLPKSSLIVLVSAFAGREATLRAYRTAVEARFRFFSFGDAMLII